MMSKSLRFTWLASLTLSASLLGACVGVEGEEQSSNVAIDINEEALDPADGDVAVEVSALGTVYSESDQVTVSVSFTNTASYPVRMLAWYTAADELEEDLFEVTLNGERMEYVGPHYKRPAPEKSDYVILGPGESITREVSLSGFYDLSQSGDYEVRYAAEVKENGKRGAVLESGKVGVWVEGRAAKGTKVEGTSNITGSVAFNKCTASQESTVLDALNAAGTMATGAASYLGGSPSGTPRYTTWFGAFSNNGWSTAQGHFTKIKDAIDTKPLTFDCGCKKKYYAYVYPNSPYVVYLCSVFWPAPLSGTDSKGGTIIHELSHFTVVGDTDDWVYGQSGAKSLAISDPSKALDNADSHEYFAENTPSLQ